MEKKAKVISFFPSSSSSSSSTAQDEITSPWQNPPDYFSDLILPRLIYPDHSRFASVCKQWRSLQKNYRLLSGRMRPLPLLLILPGRPENSAIFSPFEDCRFYRNHPILPRLCSNSVEIMHSSEGWLLLNSNRCEDIPSLSLINIVSAVELQLPPGPQFAADVEMMDAVMSSPSSFASPPGFVLVVIESERLFLHKRGSALWIPVPFDWKQITFCAGNLPIDNIIYSQGKFYCIIRCSAVLLIDPFTEIPTSQLLEMTTSKQSLIQGIKWDYHSFESLADCKGEVLLVEGFEDDRFNVREIHLFRVDVSKKMFVRVKSLEDRMLLVDGTGSHYLLASDIGGKKNSIYYALNYLAEFGKRNRRNTSTSTSMIWKPWRAIDLETGRVTDPGTCNRSLYADCWVVPR